MAIMVQGEKRWVSESLDYICSLVVCISPSSVKLSFYIWNEM